MPWYGGGKLFGTFCDQIAVARPASTGACDGVGSKVGSGNDRDNHPQVSPKSKRSCQWPIATLSFGMSARSEGSGRKNSQVQGARPNPGQLGSHFVCLPSGTITG